MHENLQSPWHYSPVSNMSSWTVFNSEYCPPQWIVLTFGYVCRPLVTDTTNKYSHCLHTANNDRKSKGEESDTASVTVVIHTYRFLSWVVALKRPSGSSVNWLLSSHLENERPNKPVNLYTKTLSEHATGREILQSLVIRRMRLYLHRKESEMCT